MRPSRLALVLLLTALSGCATPSPPALTASPSPSAQPRPPVGSRSPTAAPTATPGVTSTPVETSPASGAPPAALAPGAEQTLAQLLGLLSTAREDRTGYDRSLFRLWIDADGDGCNTRREVLIAEAVRPPTVGGGCSLIGGQWLSAYDGLVLTDASQLQIDHVVALAEAWDSGASAWTPDRRMWFANDLDASWTLIAVSSASNQSKSDKDPAEWLPPNPDDRCPFISAWIAIKVRWQLSVDQVERDALTALLADCPGRRAPYLPAPAEVAAPPAPLSDGTACSPAYPTVCIPPPPPDLNCGDVSYRRFAVLPPDPHHFDGDRDGIGCES